MGSKFARVQDSFLGIRALVGDDTLAVGDDDGRTSFPRVGDRYCAVVEVVPVNYLLASPEEQEQIILGYRRLLNALAFPIQILVRVTPLNLQPYLTQLQTRQEELAQQRTPGAPLLKDLTADAMQFVSGLATRRRLLERHFYLVIPAETAADPFRAQTLWALLQQGVRQVRFRRTHPSFVQAIQHQALARNQLSVRVNQVLGLLAASGLEARRLHGLALAQLYQSCLLPQRAQVAPVTSEQLAAVGMPSQARAPRSWRVHRQAREEVVSSEAIRDPAGLTALTGGEEADPGWLRLRDVLSPGFAEVTPSAVNLDEEYSRTFVVVGYPRHVYPGWLLHLLIDVPLDIAMHLQVVDAGGMIRRLTRQQAEFHASDRIDARQGRMPDIERQVAAQDIGRLRDHLQRGEERIYQYALYLTVRAPNGRTLDVYCAQVRATLDNLQLQAHPAMYEQDLGLRSCLPEARDHLKRFRLLDSSSVATTFPFASSSLSMQQGIFYGVAGDGGLVLLDPFSSELENANQVVFAKSGAGKSYACKLQALRLLAQGYSVYVVDPENEWRRIGEAAGGETIRLAAGASQHLNPFDLPSEPDTHERRDVLAEHIRTLMSLMDLLLAEHTTQYSATLSQREKSYLERAIAATYRLAGITADVATHAHPAPLLRDLYEVITSGVVGADTFFLAERLQRYVTGSLSDLFAGPTNVSLTNPLVVFDIRDMDAELRPIGLFLIANFVWTRTRREQSRHPRLLYIDEAWTLMQFPEGGRFLSDIARRARKYYLGLCTITQDVEDFLGNEHGRTVLANASIKLLMKQDATTIGPVSEAFHLSQGEKQFILGARKGEGVLFARGAHVALQVERSEREHQLATTNPRERADALTQTAMRQGEDVLTQSERAPSGGNAQLNGQRPARSTA